MSNKSQRTAMVQRQSERDIMRCKDIVLEAASVECLHYGPAARDEAGKSSRQLVIYQSNPTTPYYYEQTEQTLREFIDWRLQAKDDFFRNHANPAAISQAVYNSIVEEGDNADFPCIKPDQNMNSFDNGVLLVLGDDDLRPDMQFYDLSTIENLQVETGTVAARHLPQEYCAGSVEAWKLLEEFRARTVPSVALITQGLRTFFADPDQPLKITGWQRAL